MRRASAAILVLAGCIPPAVPRPEGCRVDEECASSACLADGACADAANVIYASPAGASTAGCGRELGTTECSLAQAALEVQGARNIIKLRAGTYGVAGAYQDFLQDTVLIARGSTINRAASGPGGILNVTGKSLTLIGGTISGALGDDGVQCDAGGTLAIHEAVITDNDGSGIETESCKLVVSRTTIRRNLLGGIKMSADPAVAEITNNFIYGNGGAASSIGGMDLELVVGSKVELNTIVDNVADTASASAGGIICAGNINAASNIVYRNTGGSGGQVQVIGTCTFQGSYAMAAAAGENAPGFEAPNRQTDPSFRLTRTSPAGTIRDAAPCTGVDFEGDRRPAPEGGMCDLGADEYRDGQ
jgi:hypothetical protein